MRRFAVAGVLAAAVAAPPVAVQAAPLDRAIQSLNDVVFAGGRAPGSGTTTVIPGGGLAVAGLGASSGPADSAGLAAAMARPLQPLDKNGLHLGGEVPVRTVGAFLQGKLRAMGVQDGAARYGGEGRFYLFAAVHGQAVGLNLQEEGGALRRTGWSTDQSSALVGDGQVGLGWRKGGMEAAIGYVHRGIHLKNVPIGVSDSWTDDMAALSFTFHPHWSP